MRIDDGTISIRIAYEDELPDLATLRWQWVHSQQMENNLPPLDIYRQTAADWARQHSATHIPFVAVHDAQLLGMAWLALVSRVPSPLHKDRMSGDVQSCYVVPHARGAGVGHRL